LGASALLARYLQPRVSNNSTFDGALRVFALDETVRRHNSHVRSSGKIGLREKVFRTDEPIDRDRFSVVAQAFYVGIRMSDVTWDKAVRRFDSVSRHHT